MRSFLSFVLFLTVGFACMAEAHPHVFADVTVKAVFDQNGFTGVQNQWAFDEVYSTAMVASADADGDGKITGKEADRMKALVLGPLEQNNYYNYVQFGTKFLRAEKIENFSVKMKNGKMIRMEMGQKEEIYVCDQFFRRRGKWTDRFRNKAARCHRAIPFLRQAFVHQPGIYHECSAGIV